MNDTLTIYVRDKIVDLCVGLYPHEKMESQPVAVSVALGMALSRRFDDPQETHLAATLDYGTLYNFIAETLPKRRHTPLLETIAESLVDFCFADPRVNDVRVQLEKKQIFDGSAHTGIIMHRTRVV